MPEYIYNMPGYTGRREKKKKQDDWNKRGYMRHEQHLEYCHTEQTRPWGGHYAWHARVGIPACPKAKKEKAMATSYQNGGGKITDHFRRL